jgi:NhaA family Na+:H+ antiporter
LHTWRRWLLPLAGAAGGALGAALVYLAYVDLRYQPVLERAWPVACAIDIVAGYYLLKMIFRRGAAIPFLLVLGIATNGVMLMVIALRYDYLELRPGAGALLLTALAVAVVFRLLRIRVFWPYLVVCGTLSWLAFYRGGLHPALSLVPIVPFLPREPRRLDLLEDNPPARRDTIRLAEHDWTYAVQGIVFLFGLVNAGVMLQGYGTGTWAVLTAALVGRPVGILTAVALGLALGLRRPADLGWRELGVAALATTSGFTMALFVATGVFAIGPLLAEVKLGALCTTAGAVVTLLMARTLRVGAFARRQGGVRHHRSDLQHARA